MIDIKDTYRYLSTDVALYIIACGHRDRYSLNMTKVQKLLYIVYGAFLRVYGERLVNEHPQAWPYGPVFATTRERLLKIDYVFDTIPEGAISPEKMQAMQSDEQLNTIVDFTLRHFGSWNAGQLSDWSHTTGGAWDLTRNKPHFRWGNTISDWDILEYFKKLVLVGSQDE